MSEQRNTEQNPKGSYPCGRCLTLKPAWKICHVCGCAPHRVPEGNQEPPFAQGPGSFIELLKKENQRLDSALFAACEECDGLKIDLAGQKAIVTNLHAEREHWRTVADNRNSRLDSLSAALDAADVETHHPGKGAAHRKAMMLHERIEWLAKSRDEWKRIVRTQGEEAKAETDRLRKTLAHEEGFSAFQIEKRTEAEDAADQLRLKLDETTRQLAELRKRHERLQSTSLAHDLQRVRAEREQLREKLAHIAKEVAR